MALFPDIYFRGQDRTYDIAPDGERFLMVKDATFGGQELIVVLNWFEGFERVVPTGE